MLINSLTPPEHKIVKQPRWLTVENRVTNPVQLIMKQLARSLHVHQYWIFPYLTAKLYPLLMQYLHWSPGDEYHQQIEDAMEVFLL